MLSWFASLAVALLSGLVALVAGGVVAAWGVDWYAISSREGASGFFVIGVALLSGGAGALVGLVIARGASAVPGITALKAAALSVLVVLTVVGAVGAAARLLADVPPEIDGELLYLAVELRWPAGQRPPARAAGPAEVHLGSLSRTELRRQESGPLFLDDARLEDGAWIVPGVVEIFTSRGTPVVNVFVGRTQVTSFLPPLRRRPTRDDFAWSAWQPAAPDGQPVIGVPVSYRVRVLPRSAPVRVQPAGPFAVETTANWFSRGRDQDIGVSGHYRVTRNGRVVPGADRLAWVAVVSRAPWTLLVAGDAGCRLVGESAPEEATEPVPCDWSAPAWNLLTLGDAPRQADSPSRQWLDATTFRDPGLYIVGRALIDTRAGTIAPRGWPSEPLHEQDRPPLALSPDGRTMAWFSPGNGYDSEPAIATKHLDTGATTLLPIDRRRMRYRTSDLDITPDWLAHHFRWVPRDGGDVLEARADAPLLPYRGALSEAKDGEYQTYLLSPGGRGLREAVVEILLRDLHGTRRDPDASTVDTVGVEVDGVAYDVTYSVGGDEVRVVTYRTKVAAMTRLAAHLDAVAASGHLDALFTKDVPPADPAPTP